MGVHPKGSLRTHRQTSQTTKHNILSKQLTLISSPRCFHFPCGCLGPPPQGKKGEIAVLEGGPVSGLQELECGPVCVASLFLRPRDREEADAPRSDRANARIGASRFLHFECRD